MMEYSPSPPHSPSGFYDLEPSPYGFNADIEPHNGVKTSPSGFKSSKGLGGWISGLIKRRSLKSSGGSISSNSSFNTGTSNSNVSSACSTMSGLGGENMIPGMTSSSNGHRKSRKSIIQYISSLYNGSHHDSSSPRRERSSSSTSTLKRFKFGRTSSAVSIDTKSVNKKYSHHSPHQLPTSLSCDQFNINYTKTKHQQTQQLCDSSALLPIMMVDSINQTLGCVSNSTSMMLGDINEVDEEVDHEPLPIPNTLITDTTDNQDLNGNNNNTNDGYLELERQSSMISCRISSQCEDSILNRTISSIDITDNNNDDSNINNNQNELDESRDLTRTPTLGPPPPPPIPVTPIVSISTPRPDDAAGEQSKSCGTQWHSPAKIKSQLQTRTSAPQLGINSAPKLQTSHSNPKIGTHHWWGSHNPIPPENNTLQLQMQLRIQQQQREHEAAARTQSEYFLQRATSFSKWVSAAPSSPPPMLIGTARAISSITPDDSSPELGCMSPISSMIRVYYVPLDGTTEQLYTTINNNQQNNNNNNNNQQNNELDVTINQNNVQMSYWTHTVIHNTTVREVIESISGKIGLSPDNFKLCCSNNPYDFIDDDRMLCMLRMKKFFLIEVAQEVIIHDNESNNVLNTMLGIANGSNSGSTSSTSGENQTADTTSSSSSLSTSVANANPLSSSWSPSYCKFLSSSRSLKRAHMLPDDTSPSASLECEDFLLDLPSSPCSYTPNHSMFTLGTSMGTGSLLNRSGGGGGRAAARYRFNNQPGGPLNRTHQAHSSFTDPQIEISPALKEKIKILCNYFNHYHRELENYLVQRKKRIDTLQQVLAEAGIPENSIAWQRCCKEHLQKESTYLRSKRAKIGPSDFQKLTAIGKGGFGKVYLARKKDSNEIVTLKVIRKTSYHRANQMTSVSKEKAVMMIPHTHREETQWITRLLYSFHDAHYLYLAMEYHCGGDFRALLNNLVRLEDDVASFYMAEMILAIQSLHKLGYIHRDIKPSNFVVDKNGHLKLIDFGLSKEGFISRHSRYQTTWRNLLKKDENYNLQHLTNIIQRSKDVKRHHENKNKITFSKVGSPEYMAPEMLGGKGYDMTYDYWSLGVCFFEMLFGETPFGAETPEDVFQNILDWKNILDWNYLKQFISDNALDLLKLLLCDPEKRITVDELKRHPYFEGLDWENVQKIIPPFVPQVQNEVDTSYFEGAEDIEEEGAREYDEVVEAAQEAAAGNNTLGPDPQAAPIDDDTSFRSMPFGGFNFMRFPSVVEGARAKGLLKSFYVESEKCVSRATSTSSLNSPSASCTNSPIIQSQNSKLTMNHSGNSIPYTINTNNLNNNTSPITTPTPTSPNVVGYQPKTPILRVSTKAGVTSKLNGSK